MPARPQPRRTALLAIRLVLGCAGVAVNQIALGSEPKQLQTEPNTASEVARDISNFIVVPITTDLQRRFLDSDKTLKAYVELNGAALLGKEDLATSIDAQSLSRALAALNDGGQPSKVILNTCFPDVESSRPIIDPLGKLLDGIAQWRQVSEDQCQLDARESVGQEGR